MGSNIKIFAEAHVAQTILLRTVISIRATNVKHFFLYLHAIHMSSLIEGLFTSLGHLLIRLFVSYY